MEFTMEPMRRAFWYGSYHGIHMEPMRKAFIMILAYFRGFPQYFHCEYFILPTWLVSIFRGPNSRREWHVRINHANAFDLNHMAESKVLKNMQSLFQTKWPKWRTWSLEEHEYILWSEPNGRNKRHDFNKKMWYSLIWTEMARTKGMILTRCGIPWSEPKRPERRACEFRKKLHIWHGEKEEAPWFEPYGRT